MKVIKLPLMPEEQTDNWKALIEIYEKIPKGWSLVGGQMVFLYCIDRGFDGFRGTNDSDTILDVRADSNILEKFTRVLVESGFKSAGVSPGGYQHRWLRGNVQIDVLIPDHLGERSQNKKGVTGSPTIGTPGAQEVLNRTETVNITMEEGSSGFINRPDMFGALLAKASAYTVIHDSEKLRHLEDFLTLASILEPDDIPSFTAPTKKDISRIGNAIGAIRDKFKITLTDEQSQKLSFVYQLVKESANGKN
jgi:hypothetical protein